ncbi:MAG TPA: hypothetical protein VMT20_20595 [Terriglobia bacterium]|nr:hypothetical protein [Terriglobia bacterium]
MMFTVHLIAGLWLAGILQGVDQPPLTAEAIMARVAANQDRSDQLRTEYIYHQRIHVVLQKANGTKMRDELADYVITPTPTGTQRKLTAISGYYRHKGQYLEFKGEPRPDADSVDGDMLNDFRHDLMEDEPRDGVSITIGHTNDKKDDLTEEHSKDGIARDLFPLTTDQQKDYQFKLMGEGTEQGRAVYRIAFGPKKRSDYDWAGEADIDATDFQPVRVYTKLSRPLPFLVRKLVVDLPGLGFNVQYQRQPEGVWFPTSFGTEFRIHLFMVWGRNVMISLQNTDFERAHVEHQITYESPE